MSESKPIDILSANLDGESHKEQQLIQFQDLQNDQKQASVPQISNIQEIDKQEEERHSSGSLSKRQPQNSNGFNEFFPEDNGTHHEIVEGGPSKFQQLAQFDEEDESHFDRKNHDSVNSDADWKDPKKMIGQFLGSSKKRDNDEINWEDICNDVLKFLKKPSVMITIALLSILIIMTLQYNSLQREFRDLSHKLKTEQQQRGALQSQMHSVSSNLRNVERVEHELQKKENKLEKEMKDNEQKHNLEREESKKKEDEAKKKAEEDHKNNGGWGESGNGDSHEIQMKPLVIHSQSGPPTSFFDAISRIHDKIRSMHESISSSMNGNGSPEGDDGQPHIIKIHFGSPFGGFGSPFGPPTDGPDIGGLGEPMMPHFLGLDSGDPFGPE